MDVVSLKRSVATDLTTISSDLYRRCLIIVPGCITGLSPYRVEATLLPANERLDAAEREALLISLFDLRKFGYNYGGIEVDIPGVIAGHTTTRERKRVEAWLREEMRLGQDSSSTWHNRCIVDFLVTLKQAGHCSDEDVLAEYRNAGLYKELTEQLLRLDRVNEVLGVAQAHLTEPRGVTWFAEQLLKLGEAWQEQVLAFVETRLSEAEAALRGRQQGFTAAHTVDAYRRWLSEEYLYGYRAEAAASHYQAQVAGAAEETYPDEAIRLYKSVVKGLIDGRGRENYQQATASSRA